MGKHHEGSIIRVLSQVLLKPLSLRCADSEGALHAVIQTGHSHHALHGFHFFRRPEIPFHDAVEHNEMNALVIPGICGFAKVNLKKDWIVSYSIL